MTEIVETSAERLMPDDALQLIGWRNFHDEHIVAGFTIQGLFDLYHASEKYMTLPGWFDEDENAMFVYERIKKRPTRYQAWLAA